MKKYGKLISRWMQKSWSRMDLERHDLVSPLQTEHAWAMVRRTRARCLAHGQEEVALARPLGRFMVRHFTGTASRG
jgi:hypothetical protein